MSRPYLATIGSPALRFSEAIPPPDLTVRPAAGAPPQPAEEPASAPLVEPVKGDVSVMPPVATPEARMTSPGSPHTEPGKPPAAILPDDTRPKVRAEDFLPFFQFPGSGQGNGDVTVVTPVPSAPTAAPLPASSATYRQQ